MEGIINISILVKLLDVCTRVFLLHVNTVKHLLAIVHLFYNGFTNLVFAITFLLCRKLDTVVSKLHENVSREGSPDPAKVRWLT